MKKGKSIQRFLAVMIGFIMITGMIIPAAQAQVQAFSARDYNVLMAYPDWPYMSSIVLTGYGLSTNDAMVAAGVTIGASTQSGSSINAYELSNPIVLPSNIFDDQFLDFIQVAYATPVGIFGVDVLADNDDAGLVIRDEVSLALNPLNPNNLVSASHRVDFTVPGVAVNCEFSSSLDGGATWGSDGILSSPLIPTNFEGDPVVTFDAAGNVYYACLGFDRAAGFNNLLVFRSTDGGVTWTNPAAPGAAVLDDGVDFHDKEWIAADRNPLSPFANNLYLSWTEFSPAPPFSTSSAILFKSSTDGGVTWSSEITINSGRNQMSYPFVDPSNGDVYVMFIEFNLGVGGEARVMIAKSTNGGVSFGAPTVVDDPMDNRFFEFIDSSNGVAREPPQVQGCVTGEGTVLAVWRDFPSTISPDSDIHYSNSLDGGVNWIPPVVVNLVIPGDQFFPSIACQADQAHISWGDQRFDVLPPALDTGLFDIFYRSVTPGTPPAFGAELRVTDITQDATPTGQSQIFGVEPLAGDYFDSVTSDVAFHTIWTDFRTPDPALIFGSRFVDAGIKIIVDATTVSINDVSLAEGNAGTTPFTFTVTRSDNIAAISVDFATSDGTATLADNDYQQVVVSTLSFLAGGALTDTITVQVVGDLTVEPNETFNVNLSTCVGCTIIDPLGLGTILNDDGVVGGTMIPIDTTALLLAGAQMNAAWLIPVIVVAIGFAIVIARKY